MSAPFRGNPSPAFLVEQRLRRRALSVQALAAAAALRMARERRQRRRFRVRDQNWLRRIRRVYNRTYVRRQRPYVHDEVWSNIYSYI